MKPPVNVLRLDDAEDYGPQWRDPKERHLLGWKNKQQLFVIRYRENGITRPNIYHENNYHRWINISFDCILNEWRLLSLKDTLETASLRSNNWTQP